MGFVCSAEARIAIAEVKRISCEWVPYYVFVMSVSPGSITNPTSHVSIASHPPDPNCTRKIQPFFFLRTISSSPLLPRLPLAIAPNRRTSMTTTAVPDEETPLLRDQRVSAIERVTDPEPEAVTLAGLSNQSTRPPSIKGGRNGRPDVVKKTPLPWAQFSLTLFLLLAEPLTAQVISPVSSQSFLIFCFGFA